MSTTTPTTQTTRHTTLTVIRETLKNGKTRTTVSAAGETGRPERTTRPAGAVTVGFDANRGNRSQHTWVVLSISRDAATASKRLNWWAQRGYTGSHVVTLDA